MEVRVLESNKSEGTVSFIVKDSTPSFVNALRRTMIEEVPTMAIEEVEFRKNNSILYDEMIAHRLGLVPLKTDLKSYEQLGEDGEFTLKNSVKMTMKVSKDSGKDGDYVKASELQSADPKIVPVYPDMPVFKLLKGQAVEFEATAVLGNGRMHSKWSPCHAYYKYKPIIKIGNVKNPEEIVEATHGDIFEIKNGKLEVIKDNVFKYDMAGVLEAVSDGQITVEHDDDFIFYVESWGQLAPKEIIMTALDIMDQGLDDLSAAIKNA